MYRVWSILFFSVPVLGTISLVWAMLGLPPMKDHWLPKNVNAMGASIDHLFYQDWAAEISKQERPPCIVQGGDLREDIHADRRGPSP